MAEVKTISIYNFTTDSGVVYDKIDKQLSKLITDIIFNKDSEGTEKLLEFSQSLIFHLHIMAILHILLPYSNYNRVKL